MLADPLTYAHNKWPDKASDECCRHKCWNIGTTWADGEEEGLDGTGQIKQMMGEQGRTDTLGKHFSKLKETWSKQKTFLRKHRSSGLTTQFFHSCLSNSSDSQVPSLHGRPPIMGNSVSYEEALSTLPLQLLLYPPNSTPKGQGKQSPPQCLLFSSFNILSPLNQKCGAWKETYFK